MSLLILIHRTKAEDARNMSASLFKDLKYLYYGQITIRYDGWDIELEPGIAIVFRSGEDPAKVAGLRPDYYYSDDAMVRDWIAQGAAKIGGRQIHDMNQVLSIVSLYIGYKKFFW